MTLKYVESQKFCVCQANIFHLTNQTRNIIYALNKLMMKKDTDIELIDFYINLLNT